MKCRWNQFRTLRRQWGVRRCAVVCACLVVVVGACSSSTDPRSSPQQPSGSSPSGDVVLATAKTISFHGVQMQVPAAWPVMGGNNTPVCNASWPTTPTVFIGIQPEAGILCPITPAPPRQLDGVWLQPESATPSLGLLKHTLLSGQQVEELPPLTGGPGIQLLFHHVWIEVGPATSTSDAKNLLGSLSYHPGSADSSVQNGCLTNSRYAVRPRPARLDRQMVLGQGDVTLDPPLPSDQASVSATVAWTGSRPLPTSTYRLYLARYSSKFPAAPGPDRTLIPEEQNVLAWVLYSSPVTASGQCGSSGVSVYDAHTGQPIGSQGWAPGP